MKYITGKREREKSWESWETIQNVFQKASQLYKHLRKRECDGQESSVSYVMEFIPGFEELNSVFGNVNVMVIVFTKVLSHIAS